jgi:hypothetical protein
MTCQHREADLVDLARGALAHDEAASELRRHLDVCRVCAARFERERLLTAGLRSLAEGAAVPEGAETEQQLMEAFASRATPPRPSRWVTPATRWWALATAAGVVLFLGSWAAVRWLNTSPARLVSTESPVAEAIAPPRAEDSKAAVSIPGRALVRASSDSNGRLPAARPRRTMLRDERRPDVDEFAGFIPLPAADRFPGFDSGMIVRVAIPTASLPAFGLTIAPDATRTVDADVLVGQDGQARAIRLVSLVGSRREPQ